MAAILHILKYSQIQMSQNKVLPKYILGKTSKMEIDWRLVASTVSIIFPNIVREDHFSTFFYF